MANKDMYFLGFFSYFPHNAYPFFLPLPKKTDNLELKYKFNGKEIFCQY